MSAPRTLRALAAAGALLLSVPAAARAQAPALAADLGALVRPLEDAGARYSVLVVSLDRGDTLFSHRPDAPFVPASNLKLFTTAAALHFLGRDFRWTTWLVGDGPVRDGVLHGDLVLYGTGDPTLSERMLRGGAQAAFAALADSLAAAGVREVRGAVVGDGSFFDGQLLGEGWNPSDLDAWYAAPVAGLSANENLVTVRVTPGQAGGPARVSTSPATREMALANRTATVRRGRAGVRVSREAGTMVASGAVSAQGGGTARTLPVADPVNYAAAAFAAALERAGIRVTGGVRGAAGQTTAAACFHRTTAGPACRGGVLAAHRSPALAEVVRVTNHVSHNLFADALLKTVGRVAGGEGSFGRGERAVGALLAEAGAAPAVMRDGSGLSRLDRITARSTVALLAHMDRGADGAAFRASLPRAGVAGGSLGQRMTTGPAAGNLHAKTGTIRGVSSLSGYVTAANGERLAFSIIGNEIAVSRRAKQVEDRIGARLAAFTR